MNGVKKDCNFYHERITIRNNSKYIYPKCRLTKNEHCICEYKHCTLYVNKDEYRKNQKKYPIMKYYGDYHGRI